MLRMINLKLFAVLAAGTFFANGAMAQGHYQSDSWRNINQINIGVDNSRNISSNGSSQENVDANRSEEIEKSMALKPFSRLRITVPADVEYVQGSGASVTLVGRSNALDNILLEQHAGTLTIRSSNSFLTDKGLKIRITGGALELLELAGAIDASLERIRSSRLQLKLNGAVDLKAQGRVGQCVVSLRGSSDAQLENLKCQSAQVALEGASDLYIYASKSISGSASGASDVTVSGAPSVRKLTSRGVGDVSYQ